MSGIPATAFSIAREQLAFIDTQKQCRFVYIRVNAAGQYQDVYGTNWRIWAIWHQFKYGLLCCSGLSVVGGDQQTKENYERVHPLLKGAITSRAQTIISSIQALSSLEEITQWRADTDFLLYLGSDDLNSLESALDLRENEIKRIRNRNALPMEMQIALNALQDKSKSIPERQKLIREFLPVLKNRYVEGPVCMVEIKIALITLVEQMKNAPAVNAMDLETAIKEFSELGSWIGLYSERGRSWKDNFYGLVGQYVIANQPALEKQLSEELGKLKKEEEKLKEARAKLDEQIAPLRKQRQEASDVFWEAHRQRDKLYQEHAKELEKLSEPIFAFQKKVDRAQWLEAEIKKQEAYKQDSINREQRDYRGYSTQGDDKLHYSQMRSFKKDKQTDCSTAIEAYQKELNELSQKIKEDMTPEKVALRETNEKAKEEATRKYEKERKELLEETAKNADAKMKELDDQIKPLQQKKYELWTPLSMVQSSQSKIEMLQKAIKDKELEQVGTAFLTLYVW